MGLDMYLTKKTYVGLGDQSTFTITGLKSSIQPSRVRYIIECVGYWRKANAIHRWFVEHQQDGVDDGNSYYVSEEQLQELLDTVNKVLAASELVGDEDHIKVIKDPSVAQELLPTQEGFFFGGKDYDQYYYQSLIDTKKVLSQVLEEGGEFEYQASW